MNDESPAGPVTGSTGPGGLGREGASRARLFVALVATIIPLAACDTMNYAAKQEALTPVPPVTVTEIRVGSQLTLRVPLDLPAGGAPLLFQRNAIATPAALAKNAPFCRLAATSAAATRVPAPTTFTVRTIDYDERDPTAAGKPVSITHYRLASGSKQPEYVLSCQWPEGAPALTFVTAGEVQATISAFFTLDPVR